MQFYTKSHAQDCGIDLHAKTMYLCIKRAEASPQTTGQRGRGRSRMNERGNRRVLGTRSSKSASTKSPDGCWAAPVGSGVEDGLRLRRKPLVLGQVVEDLIPRCLRLHVDVHDWIRGRLLVQACSKNHRYLRCRLRPIEEAACAAPAEVAKALGGLVPAELGVARRDAQVLAADEARGNEGGSMGAPAVLAVAIDEWAD